MLNIFLILLKSLLILLQIINCILIIFLIGPQTSTDNIVLQRFVESGLFINYMEAKDVLNFLSWFLLFFFLIFNFLFFI